MIQHYISLCLWITFPILVNGESRQDLEQQYGEAEEVCPTEVFGAVCPDLDKVIYIELALYGRMSLGRCVQKDYGHVGCQGDVTRHTDRRCSGRRMCRIRIPDADFDLSHPCPVEFKTYFLVSYKCLKITMPSEDEACSHDHFIHINSPFGYIASITTRERGYGSLTCPWKITLPHGQRVNLTLIDFSTPEYNRRDLSKHAGVMPYRFLDRDSQCQYPYAILTERWSADRTVRVCGGYQRDTHVMLSRTNSVEIRIVTNTAAHVGDEHFFILKYEAVGCPSPESPPYGWVERDIDGALFHCNFTSLTWRWFCRDTEWIGPTHNCTSEPAPTPSMIQWGTISLPYGVSVGIIVGLALIACVIVMLVGLIFLEWRKMKRTERAQIMAAMTKLNTSTPSPPEECKESHQCEARNSIYTDEPPESAKQSDPDNDDANTDYTYVREMWPLAPPAPNSVNGENVFIKTHGLSQSEQSMLDVGYTIDGVTVAPRYPEIERHIYESPRKASAVDGTTTLPNGRLSAVTNPTPAVGKHPTSTVIHSGSDNGFFEEDNDPINYKSCLV